MWESDWFDDGTFDCSGGTTSVELFFVSSSPYEGSYYCDITEEELCSWAGSTATIRSVASEPGGDCSTPAYECSTCLDLPTDASLEVEWVPGANWGSMGECYQSQFLSRVGLYPLTVIDGCKMYSEPFSVPCNYCQGTAMRSVGVSFSGGAAYGTGDCFAQIGMTVGLRLSSNNYGVFMCTTDTSQEQSPRYVFVDKPDLIVADHVNCPGFDGTVAVLDYAYTDRFGNWIYPGYYNLTFRCS